MARWTIVGTGHEPGLNSLRVIASTSVPDHIYMSWAPYRPIQQEIWRRVRGKLIFCGYKYIWDTPTTVQQQPEGDTLAHWFYLTNLEAGSEVWYYLHAPNPPSLYETQGPLMHVHLLKPPSWSTCLYFASREKGMFRTSDFSGPGGPQPTWVPDNAGLPFYDIRQACADPWDPYHRRFVICHEDVYRMDNDYTQEPAIATRVLAQWEAVYLTGGLPGHIDWLANSPNFPGHFYALFTRDIPGAARYCIKTQDYGLTWTAHLIQGILFSYHSGNIMAGDFQGDSPHLPGHVLYAAYIGGSLSNPHAAISTDEGETWTPISTFATAVGSWEPRLYVDPANHGTVYIGAASLSADLWRSTDHGASWALADDGNHLGIAISPTTIYSTMGTRQSDPAAIRVIASRHIWLSSDFGLIWRDQGESQYDTAHMHFCDHAPDFLYLARTFQPLHPTGLYAYHTLFVSDDEGSNMFGKSGTHAHLPDGGGDSIPYDCGGVSQQGVLTLPYT